MSGDTAARLHCFDQWAATQASPPPLASAPEAPPQPATAPVVIAMVAPTAHDCKDAQFSELSRFWELEAGTNCGTFGIRGYKPISLSVIGSNSVNTQPDSVLPDHRATSALAFRTTETRIQLSVRTKIAEGMLTQNQPLKRDSLWFGYSQQSNWQIFSGDLSRPFRTTDHEPELIYIYPTDLDLPGNWRLRYAGLALNHNSNGQPLPLSRSWNRAILMAGLENGPEFQLLGKLWYRLPEKSGSDDNPEISDLVGRSELTGLWNPDLKNTFGLTMRHSLRSKANGSVKLAWLRKLNSTDDGGGKPGGLQLHTQVFSGYGDSLIDYNRRRTVLSVGLSLVDW
ncbi:phospholipase A [Rhodoferax antarcticus]|uniref:phospholipase A n=1 Tax=Rhodoferax antarcticus TaxID=81479 RepID=UPI00222566F0|nr:phospholipase A [Rhodoferax antarcticus]MCW2312873.1 phospholipase A1 [Rhodoferax antarcticus]